MREAKVNKSELARRLDWHMPQVDRVLDVHHASQLDQLDAAFGALGKHLLVTGPYRGSVGRFASSVMTGIPRPRSRASSDSSAAASYAGLLCGRPSRRPPRACSSVWLRPAAREPQRQTHCPAPTRLPSHDYHSGGSPVLGFNRRHDIRSAGSHPQQRYSDDREDGFRVGVALPTGICAFASAGTAATEPDQTPSIAVACNLVLIVLE